MSAENKENKDKKNDLIFLGINFHNFFNNCCIERALEDKSTSSDGGKKQKHPLKNNSPKKSPMETEKATPQAAPLENDDKNSAASSTEWIDLEDLLLPGGLPSFNETTAMEEEIGILTGTPADEYLTEEPIDFEYLRRITGVDQEEDEKSRSATSGLSQNSKKISKQSISGTKIDAKNTARMDSGIKGKRKAWQPHEDSKVLELVGKYGPSWAVIASMMEGRTGKQIRDRYLNKLKPNIKKAEWTVEEDRLLLSCYYQMGHKWSKIATFLPGRTEGQVKNRFYSHLKKRIHVSDEDQRFVPNGNGQPILENQIQQQHPLIEPARPANLFMSSPFSKSERDESSGGMPSPGTITTDSSKINCEQDIDDILDRVAGYVEKKPEFKLSSDAALDLEKMTLQEKLATVANKENMSNNNIDKLSHMERLQNRKKKLEFLLAQTLKDMEVMVPSGGNEQGQGQGQVLGQKVMNM